MRLFKCTSFVLVTLLLPCGSLAADDESVQLAGWLEELDVEQTPAFPYRIVAVKALPQAGIDPVFADLDKAETEKKTYLRLADPKVVAWNYKLNRAAYAAREPLDALLLASGADTILVMPDKGKWELVRVNGGKAETLVAYSPPKKRTVVGLAKWLPKALGWDGVVLATKGEYILVGSTSQILVTPEVQALAVEDSAGKPVLAADREGAGLLSLSQRQDGWGVFDVVFLAQGLKTIPVGTKLIIERKKKQR